MITIQLTGTAQLAQALAMLPKSVSRPIQLRALTQAAKPMRDAMAAKANRSHFLKEHLADHIVIGSIGARTLRKRGRFEETVVEVGPAAGKSGKDWFYGCVFGPSTYITTDKGVRAISSIEVGDKVLTQTGEYRTVTATRHFPATHKPDLVTVWVEYQKGLEHTLTLTTDHKVLVVRDEKCQWVKAGLLLAGDTVVRRRTRPISDGSVAPESLTGKAWQRDSARQSASFADADTFEEARLIGVERWMYKPRGEAMALLYDLTVEGVPSFVASGIVIHNSFLEFGTVKMRAYPFMRPAFDAEAQNSLNIIMHKLWASIHHQATARPLWGSSGP